MNDKNTAIAYTEVDAILNMMDSKYVEKIPRKLRDMFKEERLNDYEPKIDPIESLENQNLQRETLVILAMLNLNYWCESEEEKNNLIKEYAENDKKMEQELREKYNPDNLFKRKNAAIKVSENTELIEYKENFLIKIWNKIKHFFRERGKMQ